MFRAGQEKGPQDSVGAGSDMTDQDMSDQTALPETRSKILISMKLASRELGVLSVESDHENAFSVDDRVLLESVANTLARFLAGRGKYLVSEAPRVIRLGSA